jgi:hypothetical protein
MRCSKCGCTEERACNVGGYGCSWTSVKGRTKPVCTACDNGETLEAIIKFRPRTMSLGEFLGKILIPIFQGADDDTLLEHADAASAKLHDERRAVAG